MSVIAVESKPVPEAAPSKPEPRFHIDDVLSSFVVFLVALPLCLGIAIASGVPPAQGILTGIIGGLVAGMLAGCPLQVSGPAAGLAVFTYQLVQEHGIAALGPVVLLGGMIQLAAGLLKCGQLFRAISPSVIHGMLAGIGVLIFAAQFHVMVDDKPRATGWQSLLSIPEAIYKGVFPLDGSSHHLAAFIGLVTIAILVLWANFVAKHVKVVPGALVAVLAATIIAGVFGLPIRYVDVPSSLISAISFPQWSDLLKLLRSDMLVSAIALAFVASAETLLSAAAVDRMHGGKKTNYDRELASQGVGNILCGIAGGLPMTGVIVRSATNVNAGARTRMSAVLQGAWLLVLVALFPQVLRLIPTASLAAVLVYTGYKLVNPASIREIRKFGPFPFAIYTATVVTIVATDLLTGILIGLGLSIVKLVYTLTHLGIRVEQSIDGKRFDIHLEGAATFVRLPQLADSLEAVPLTVEAYVRIGKLDYIDHACIDHLIEWEKQRTARGSVVSVEWDELMHMYHLRNRFRPARAAGAA